MYTPRSQRYAEVMDQASRCYQSAEAEVIKRWVRKVMSEVWGDQPPSGYSFANLPTPSLPAYPTDMELSHLQTANSLFFANNQDVLQLNRSPSGIFVRPPSGPPPLHSFMGPPPAPTPEPDTEPEPSPKQRPVFKQPPDNIGKQPPAHLANYNPPSRATSKPPPPIPAEFPHIPTPPPRPKPTAPVSVPPPPPSGRVVTQSATNPPLTAKVLNCDVLVRNSDN